MCYVYDHCRCMCTRFDQGVNMITTPIGLHYKHMCLKRSWLTEWEIFTLKSVTFSKVSGYRLLCISRYCIFRHTVKSLFHKINPQLQCVVAIYLVDMSVNNYAVNVREIPLTFLQSHDNSLMQYHVIGDTVNLREIPYTFLLLWDGSLMSYNLTVYWYTVVFDLYGNMCLYHTFIVLHCTTVTKLCAPFSFRYIKYSLLIFHLHDLSNHIQAHTKADVFYLQTST